jgi:calcineurin-like phosphoesterase family protein
MKIVLTTDTHFFHRKMEELCGRPRDFEIRIYKALKAILTPEDILIHLGDICIGRDLEAHAMFIQTLPGKHWLVRGNHDRKSNNWYLNHGWDFISDSFRDVYFGQMVLFSHVPSPDSGYDLNVHGHFHNTDHRNHEPALVAIKNDKQKLLALENHNYQPWLLESIIKSSLS